uniref:D-isomer specific 2-hydroxyacid dehydrogenase NAD-binding domain-containing protein n=1 Tax=Takifugu rubripes TaxID=31033 RepID=A0A674P865_TAKRU
MLCETRVRFFVVTDRKMPSVAEGSKDPGERATGVQLRLSLTLSQLSYFGMLGPSRVERSLSCFRNVKEEQAVGARYCQSLDELLKDSDFVVLAVNLTPETTGLIGHRELSLMRSTATLVNISRGQVVDQDALVDALRSGTIRGAALDVTYPEPLPRDHPLLSLPNVVITTHIGTNTMNTCHRMVESMINNSLAVLTGQPIPNEVRAQ